MADTYILDDDDAEFARKVAKSLHEIEMEERRNQLEALPKWLAGEAPFYLKDGWEFELTPLTFGRYRLVVSNKVDTYEEQWDFPGELPARIAFAVWEAQGFYGDPLGWERAMTKDAEGEYVMFRRRPDLTPESEYEGP